MVTPLSHILIQILSIIDSKNTPGISVESKFTSTSMAITIVDARPDECDDFIPLISNYLKQFTGPKGEYVITQNSFGDTHNILIQLIRFYHN